jgi:serine/threonine protein kinase
MSIIAKESDINLANIIESEYSINFSNVIESFSTEFATAYETKSNNDDGKYYTLVFQKNFPVNLSLIHAYSEINEDSVQKVVDYGRIKDSSGKLSIGALLRIPTGQSFGEILKSRQDGYEESYVFGFILAQLFATIDFLHKKRIMHGLLNLDKIYYDREGAKITIMENFSEYPGFSQRAEYETYERLACHPAGKSDRDYSADFYAMGCVMAFLLRGENPFQQLPGDIVRKIKYENGSYDSIYNFSTKGIDISLSSRNEQLLKSLLHDKNIDRWDSERIRKWQKKQVFQSPASRVHRQISHSFTFNEMDFYNPRYLAYELHKNWSLAKKSLNIEDIARWITFISKFNDIEKKMYYLTRNMQGRLIIDDEKITRLIMFLDEEGPIRIRETSVHPDGIGNLYCYYYFNEDREGMNDILGMIDYGTVDGWVSLQEREDLYKSIYMGFSIQKAKTYIRVKSLGFGAVRLLYELNPYLHCQSKYLENYYVADLKSLMFYLEEAKPIYEENEAIDNHLFCYLCKFNKIDEPLKIKKLHNFPVVEKLPEVKLCAVMALAQKNVGISKLPNMTLWIRKNLFTVSSVLKSSNIKKALSEDLDKAVTTGDISKLFSVIIEKNLIRKDLYGFKEARKQYKLLALEIAKLQSMKNLNDMAVKTGLKISVLFSYMIATISILLIAIFNFEF